MKRFSLIALVLMTMVFLNASCGDSDGSASESDGASSTTTNQIDEMRLDEGTLE